MLSFLDCVFFLFLFFPSVFFLSGVIVSAQLIIFIPSLCAVRYEVNNGHAALLKNLRRRRGNDVIVVAFWFIGSYT